MKKYFLGLFLFFSIVTALFAEEKPFLTVLDFTSNNIAEMEVVVFVDYLSSQIQKSGQYRVIDRMQRENILNELKFSNSGCTDESCQLEIGKLIQAKNVIVGSMGAVGDSQILNIKLVDVETGESLNTASRLYSDMNEMLAESSALIEELLGIGKIIKTPIKVTNTEDSEPTTEPEYQKEQVPVIEITDPKLEPEIVKIDYTDVVPAVDFIIPGIAHYDANNGVVGTLYLISAIGGVALFGISEYMYNSDLTAYSQASSASDATSLYNSAESWRNLSITGVSIWAGAALISFIHSSIAKSLEGN